MGIKILSQFNSFMMEVLDIQSKSLDWFLYDRDICHKRVNPLHANTSIYFNDFKYS